MKYVLMIYQGPTPTLPGSDRWKALAEAEQKAIYADYAEISKAPDAAPVNSERKPSKRLKGAPGHSAKFHVSPSFSETLLRLRPGRAERLI